MGSYHDITVALFDIDGTLVNSRFEFPPTAPVLLQKIRAAGVRVGLATGRPFFGARAIIDALAIRDPSMFFAGAAVIDPISSEVLFKRSIDHSTLNALIQQLTEADLYFELYNLHDYFIPRRSHLTDLHAEYLDRAPHISDPHKTARAGEIFKLVIVIEHESELLLLKEMLTRFPQCAVTYSTGAAHGQIVFANITSAEASRASVFEALLAIYGVAREQIIAFGDSEADLPFLAAAGIGVAMRNSPAHVREAADVIAPSVEEDGVTVVLEHLLSEKSREA